MSKNEFLEVLNQFMDSVVTKDNLPNLSAMDQDDICELVEREVSDAIADEVRNWDYVERSDLDEYVDYNDLDDRIETVATDYLNLCDRDEVESIVGDFIDEHDFTDAVDDVVNTYDWDVILSDSVVMEKIKKLEVKLAMYEVLEILDAVRG